MDRRQLNASTRCRAVDVRRAAQRGSASSTIAFEARSSQRLREGFGARLVLDLRREFELRRSRQALSAGLLLSGFLVGCVGQQVKNVVFNN